MEMNRDVELAPEDTDVIFGFEFDKLSWPVVIVGERTTFKGKTHYLWKGVYDDVFTLLRNEGYLGKDVDPIPSWFSII